MRRRSMKKFVEEELRMCYLFCEDFENWLKPEKEQLAMLQERCESVIKFEAEHQFETDQSYENWLKLPEEKQRAILKELRVKALLAIHSDA